MPVEEARLILVYGLITIGCLISFVAGIWLLITAFRVSVGWGLLIFFLGWTWIPIIVFAVKYWEKAKRPIIIYGAGFAVAVLATAVGTLVLGLELGSVMEDSGDVIAMPSADVEADRPVLPPPRPTALPTHPSWEAIVNEVDRDKDDTSWEELVPSPTPATGRPDQLTWAQLNSFAGRTVIIEIKRGVPFTATLEGAKGDRVRVRHVIGGGEASYWIEREKITSIRLAH